MAFTPAAARALRVMRRQGSKAWAHAHSLVMRWRLAIAEVRIHRARLEAELYRNRYRLRTKNDDDLPIMP